MKIIFVCTGNTCRSPMAKFLLEDLVLKANKSHIKVLSAGTSVYAPMPISTHAKTLLNEKNIDASFHRSMLFTPKLADEDSLILTMTKGHKQAVLNSYPALLPQTYALFEYIGEGQDISDPYGGSLEIYRTCMSEIEHLVNKLYLQI